jgi:hypothetical protein
MAENSEDIILNAIDNATQQITKVADSLEALEKKAKEPINRRADFSAKLTAIKAAAQSAWNGAKDLIKSFQEQEQASARLTQALKNQGKYTAETQKSIEDYSSALQCQLTLPRGLTSGGNSL